MIGVNLIPTEMLVRHAVKRRLWRWTMSSVVLAAAALTPPLVEDRQQAQVESLQGKVDDVDARLDVMRGQVAATAQAVHDADAELTRSLALRTKRSWAGLLALVSGCMPEAVWLTALATDPSQPAGSSRTEPNRGREGTGKSEGAMKRRSDEEEGSPSGGPAVVVLEAPTKLRLDGFALDHESLYDFMSKLRDSGSFSVVKPIRADAEPVLQGRAVHFVLSCEW
ncbi:MAG: hypothetical protein V2A79_14260 [Planctomycetota bacterium]